MSRVGLAAAAGALVVAAGSLAVVAVRSGSSGPSRRAGAEAAPSVPAGSAGAPSGAPRSPDGAPVSSVVQPAPHPPGLGVGDQGPAVASVQQRLADLHYDVGAVDGQFGEGTEQGVIAFQKVMGLARTGRATDDVVAALPTAAEPPPLVPGGGGDRVEIDLPRQVLFLYQGGALDRIIMISTGSGHHYCEKGDCGDALTPAGSYQVGTKIRGLHISPLGQLWNPLFFNGGIAIHGSPSVPTYPASHGCVRIPMSDSEWFFAQVPSGTPVYVIGGQRAPAPVSAPSTSQPATTTTTAPAARPPTPATTQPTQPTTTTTGRPASTTTTA